MKDTQIQKGRIDLVLRDKDGTIIKDWTVFNTITNTGKAALAGLAGNTGSITAFTYLAVGTSSTAAAATQTTLGAEIVTNSLTRSSATVSRTTITQTNDTLSLAYTWTASGSSTVEEIGIFNAASVGIMLGRALTGSTALVSGDQLQATYTVQFT